MAVIYRIRPFLWAQISKVCAFALAQIQALSPSNILDNQGVRI